MSPLEAACISLAYFEMFKYIHYIMKINIYMYILLYILYICI